jgi:hypothetical protein
MESTNQERELQRRRQAGGWPGQFAALIGEVRGVETAPIEFDVADDLAHWRAAIPGRALASAEALTGRPPFPDSASSS